MISLPYKLRDLEPFYPLMHMKQTSLRHSCNEESRLIITPIWESTEVLCEIRAEVGEWTSIRRAREEPCVQGPEAGGGLVHAE